MAYQKIVVTVGPGDADIIGTDSRALQLAVDAVYAQGGGTVLIRPGQYTMYDSLHLRSGVNVKGSGRDTMLKKCDGVKSALTIDGDNGEEKITVENASGFREGMGVSVLDKVHSRGWYVAVRTITDIDENTLYLSGALELDCLVSREAWAQNTFPILSGIDVEDTRVEGLVVDGNKEKNESLNGCRGGGIYFHRSRNSTVKDCVVHDFDADGIAFHLSRDITIEACEVYNNPGFGFHPGSGTWRPVVRGCKMHNNGSIGLFLCWRVKNGVFEENEIYDNGQYGISIGHKDTDNLFVKNVIRRNGRAGIYFRDETEANAGHRNVVRENIIQDNGGQKEGYGILIDGLTRHLLIRNNTIAETRSEKERRQRYGIFVGPKADYISATDNKFSGNIEEDIYDESKSPNNKFK